MKNINNNEAAEIYPAVRNLGLYTIVRLSRSCYYR